MTKKLLKNNFKFQTKSLAFKIIFTLLSIAIITAIIIAANSRLSTPAGSAFVSFPTHCRYEWVDQSGAKSADGKAHEVYANAGDTIPMYLTIRNRNIDPLALVMYGIPPQGTLLPEVAPHRGGHEFRIGVKNDEILSWIDSSSFYPNPDGDDNRFAVYDGPDANVGDELILTWNLKIKDDADGIYNLYTGIVREFDNWPWQVDVYGSVIPGGSDIFWKFIISPGEPDPETELDKIEIVDGDGVALNSFEIDEEDNKQFSAKAYDTDGKDITSNTDFTWSINSQYNPVDVGYVTQTGLYTAGTTADFYLGAIRLMGSYNNRTGSDAVSVTIGEVPPFGGDSEIDRVEIVDSNGTSLPSFNIDQDIDKQLYVKAYDIVGNNITLDTEFTWSIDSKYSPTDVGTITNPGGLYTSGVKAGSYTGAIKVSGLYNEISKLDTANVTINGPGIELDRVEITDITGSPLPSFDIDQDTNKQLYAKAYSTTNEDITSDTNFTWSIDSKYSPTDVGTITNPGGLYTSGSTAGFYNGAIKVSGLYNEISKLDTANVTINESYHATGPEFNLVSITPTKPIKGEHAFVYFKVSETEVGDGIEKVVISISEIAPIEIQCNNEAICETTQKILMPIERDTDWREDNLSLKLEATDSDETTTYETNVTLLPGITLTINDVSPPNDLFDKSATKLYYDGVFDFSVFDGPISYSERSPEMVMYKISYNVQGWKGQEWDIVGWLYMLKDTNYNDKNKMIVSYYRPMTDDEFIRDMLARYRIPIFAIQTQLPPTYTFETGSPYGPYFNGSSEDQMVQFAEQQRDRIKTEHGINLSNWRIPGYAIAKTYIRTMLMLNKELRNSPELQSYGLKPTEFVLQGGSKRVLAMWPATAYVNNYQSQLGFKVKGFLGAGASFVDAVGVGSNLGMYGRKEEMWGNIESGWLRDLLYAETDKRYIDPIYYIDKINNSGVHHVNMFGTSDPMGGILGVPESNGFPLLHVYDYIPKLNSKQLVYAAGRTHDGGAQYSMGAWNLLIQQTFFGRPKQDLTNYISESVVENPPGSGNLTLQIRIDPPVGVSNYEIENSRIYYIMENDATGPGAHKKYVFELSKEEDYSGSCNPPPINSNGNYHCGINMESQSGSTWTYTFSNTERDILINQNRKLVYYIELEDKFKNTGCLFSNDADCFAEGYRTSMAKVCYYLGAPDWFECGGPYDLDDSR